MYDTRHAVRLILLLCLGLAYGYPRSASVEVLDAIPELHRVQVVTGECTAVPITKCVTVAALGLVAGGALTVATPVQSALLASL